MHQGVTEKVPATTNALSMRSNTFQRANPSWGCSNNEPEETMNKNEIYFTQLPFFIILCHPIVV